MKILIVDDDHLILNLLKKTLAFTGIYDVTLAESAEQAAQIIAQESPPFDFMLIDMRMPRVEGDDLCYWVRQLPEYTKIPIVMVTALAKKAAVDRAFAAGASDYITKPLDLPEFISRINQIKQQIEQNNYRARNSANIQGQKVGADRTDFTKPERVGGIRTEIELSALENYLFHLSKSGISDMGAFSFVIKDAAKLHFVCPRAQYVEILKATGILISKYLSAPQLFLSYAGYGAFVGVAEGVGHHENFRDEIERNVQENLKSIQIPSSIGAPIGVVPFMSTPQKLNVWRGQKAVDTLYRVIAEAEFRCGPALAVAQNSI